MGAVENKIKANSALKFNLSGGLLRLTLATPVVCMLMLYVLFILIKSYQKNIIVSVILKFF